VRQCRARRTFDVDRVTVEFVADLAGRSQRFCPHYPAEQSALLALAAAADTVRAVRAVPGWTSTTGGLARALAGNRRWPGPALLITTEVPQVSPGLLVEAAELLRGFDAVLGPATGDGWWAFGLREPAHAALLRQTPGALTGVGVLTVAALRLGLRVAMLPTLHALHNGSDVRPVAAHCPPGSVFAATVARLAAGRRDDRGR
jgi:hypothetical protein